MLLGESGLFVVVAVVLMVVVAAMAAAVVVVMVVAKGVDWRFLLFHFFRKDLSITKKMY